MLRLFAALPIRSDIAEHLTPLQKGVAGASWRPQVNFHITLRFFGDVDRNLAYDLDAALADIRARMSAKAASRSYARLRSTSPKKRNVM